MRKCDWTDEQIEILKNGYESNLSIKDIAELTNKSENGVKMKASRLKISKPHPKKSMPHIDLSGKKFGRLSVISVDHKNIYGHMIWKCSCDCGNPEYIYVSEYNLLSGHSQSCGCISVENCKKNFKKFNKYDLSNEYGIGYLDNDKQFIFDKEDYELIKDFFWRTTLAGYIQTTDSDNKTIRMFHRLVLGLYKNENEYSNMDVDHINGNTFDNRKSNLRVVTRTQNNMNRQLQSNNTSGVTGVSWDNSRGLWHSQIQMNNKHINLGYYENFDEAVKIRKKAEDEYFQEYSYDNSRNK